MAIFIVSDTSCFQSRSASVAAAGPGKYRDSNGHQELPIVQLAKEEGFNNLLYNPPDK
jgi:hypothetical protein